MKTMYSPFAAIALPQASEWLVVISMLAFVALWIKSILEIINTNYSNSTNKIGWLLVVILAPVVGLLLVMAGRASIKKSFETK